jgi:hypothetical protein
MVAGQRKQRKTNRCFDREMKCYRKLGRIWRISTHGCGEPVFILAEMCVREGLYDVHVNNILVHCKNTGSAQLESLVWFCGASNTCTTKGNLLKLTFPGPPDL